ncbi:ABC transporter permease [Kibdelosporangium philippinense]|uniref:ABC transporter permease n=1 Tax=Kibdelosporangium philippinense TaxID=211113 RepID=A0ABS8ZL32_9PSEU|nr:ABC transporter permease [Kibdelosporangium philippinense]MCE7007645.1 ABC transporter permease [Kibdelosporangium philippinense]
MTRTQVWVSRGYCVYAALVVLVIINCSISATFLTPDTLYAQLVAVAPVVIAALGVALVIGTGGIDLSIGAVMSISAALFPASPVLALLAGAMAGALSGSLIAVFGVQPIVATLAILVGGRGLANVLGQPQGSIPHPVLIAVVLVVVVAFLAERTTYGRQLVAIGGNRKAAGYSGLPVTRVLITTYVLCGVFAALAGALPAPQHVYPIHTGLASISAVIVSGTPLSGGQVRVRGTIAGALVMQLLTTALLTLGTPTSLILMFHAVIIIVAVLRCVR